MPLQATHRWHEECPGTRWFRADLHVHTFDDRDGGKVALPPELAAGDPADPAWLRCYSHAVLDAAISEGIEVLGLTPHDVRFDGSRSATWAIVEAWLGDARADGTAYRDLIYAVFPGFEPALSDGQSGVHISFLFDPTIGREGYFRAFDAVMHGISPWQDGKLCSSDATTREALEKIDRLRPRKPDGSLMPDAWEFLAVAPHAFAKHKGLFAALKAENLRRFPAHGLVGLELQDQQLPEDIERKSPQIWEAMQGHRHALFHSSDAYALVGTPGAAGIGTRFTLVKLANPTISALRQAFLGAESRLRIAYEKDAHGALTVREDLPDPVPVDRPWIRGLAIPDGPSFHAGHEFRFSPDLTCVIGGSMTGKSTLLDGLRYWLSGEGGLPTPDRRLAETVSARARDRFLVGSPNIEASTPFGSPAEDARRRLGSMRFFTQGELAHLSRDDEGIEELLFRLAPGEEALFLFEHRNELAQLDEELREFASELTRLEGKLGEAEEAFARTERARREMARFAAAGVDRLPPLESDAARLARLLEQCRKAARPAHELRNLIGEIEIPPLHRPDSIDGAAFAQARSRALDGANAAHEAMGALSRLVEDARSAASEELAQRTREVQNALVASGGTASDLKVFSTLSQDARLHDSFRAARDEQRGLRDAARTRLASLLDYRSNRQAELREQVIHIQETLRARFGGRISLVVEPEGRKQWLERWILDLKEPGLTRWWNNNGRTEATASAIQRVARELSADNRDAAAQACGGLGMTDTIAGRLMALLASAERRLELLVLRCPDRYRIQWSEAGGDAPKDLGTLSGGRRIAVLLTLLLESDDPTPLVIDQPEDELDNRYLNETIIPALHRLKGRRQVIFATHNANLVVNGDADQVIALSADADHSTIDAEGAIEDPEVRDAILRTLDGGKTAFELRRQKYGF